MQLGILRGELSRLHEVNVISRFLPHAIGHHLGLNVHDEVGFPTLLAEGHTVTVEPGCYFYPGLMKELHLQRFSGVCCRACCLPVGHIMQTYCSRVWMWKRICLFACYPTSRTHVVCLVALMPDRMGTQLVDFGVLERYVGVGGIRLEDNIAVGASGIENLVCLLWSVSLGCTSPCCLPSRGTFFRHRQSRGPRKWRPW